MFKLPCVAGFLIAAVCVSAQDGFGFGPLRVGERNPLYRQFYTAKAEAAEPTAPGRWALETGVDFANVFERAGNGVFYHEIDMEMLLGDVVARRGFAGGWELGVDLGAHSYFSGFMDSFIQEFHQTFGLPNDTRDEIPDNSYRYFLEQIGGEVLVDTPRQSLALADPVGFVKKRIRPGLAVKAAVKAPLGAAAISSGRADLGVELLFRGGMGPWRFHGLLGVATIRSPRNLDFIANDAALSAMASFERAIASRAVFILQLDGGSPYFNGTGLETLDEPPLNLTLGFAGRFRGGPRWQAAFAEDLSAKGPSVDFALHFRLMWTF